MHDTCLVLFVHATLIGGRIFLLGVVVPTSLFLLRRPLLFEASDDLASVKLPPANTKAERCKCLAPIIGRGIKVLTVVVKAGDIQLQGGAYFPGA